MVIVITAADVEVAVARWLKEEKNVTVNPNDIKWTESFTHPVYPLHVRIK